MRTSEKKAVGRFLRKGSGSENEEELSTTATVTQSPTKIHFSQSSAEILRGRSPQKGEEEKSRANSSQTSDLRDISISSS